MNSDDLRRFVIEVLHETTKSELDYVFLNLFRVDPNIDRKTEFHEFAPFILKHAGEIALQKFHREQTTGKSTLSEEELFIVFCNAFSFLKSVPKSRGAVTHIYTRINKNGSVQYGGYFQWIDKALAKRFQGL